MAIELALSPLNLVGGVVGLFACILLTFWRRSLTTFDFLFALLLNVPLIGSISELMKSDPTARPSTLLIFTALGVGGIGLGWIVGLVWFLVRRSREAAY